MKNIIFSFFPLFIIILLIIINGIFVAAEFVVISVSRGKIGRLAVRGNTVAQRILQVLKDPVKQDRYLATAQVCITLASLGLGMYGESIIAEWFWKLFCKIGIYHWVFAHSLAVLLAVCFLTYLHIVLGELLPKTIALQYSERTILLIMMPMYWIEMAFYPLVIGLKKSAKIILRLLGIKREMTTSHYHSPEELRLIVKESCDWGLLEEEAYKMVNDLLNFGNLYAKDVEVPRVKINAIPMGASPEEIKKILNNTLHSRYPVYEKNLDNILGMIHIKDLISLLLKKRSLEKGDLRPIPYISGALSVDDILSEFKKTKTHMAVVMDEHGGTSGLVTIDDIFQEVVGHIKENIKESSEIYVGDDGKLRALGTVRLQRLSQYLGIDVDNNKVFTLSGLILMILGKPPKAGDSIDYNEVNFTVETVEGRGAKTCIIR